MLSGLFSFMRDHRPLPVEPDAVIKGGMRVGRRRAAATRAELAGILEEVNHDVFGVSIEERHRTIHVRRVSVDDAELLDIPTVQRRGWRRRLGR